MSGPLANIQTALCAAAPLGADGDVPEWIHLLPASGPVKTGDGRKYVIRDLQQIMEASLVEGDRLVIDENHSTDLAAPKGGAAPARGWITALQLRDDGLWGKVEWTDAGKAMVEAREYRKISPVISHRKDGTIVAIARASLVNKPNFTELAALNQEELPMNFMQKLAHALGLGEDADEKAVLAAIGKMKKPDEVKSATQAAVAPFAEALGLEEDADSEAITTAITSLQSSAGKDGEIIAALQTELGKTSKVLQALQTEQQRDKAERFVDNAIAEGRVGVKPKRELYVSMHMENAKRTEELVAAMPKLDSGELPTRDVTSDGDHSDPQELALQAQKYQKEQADAGCEIDFATAVRTVQEGKDT